MIVLKTNPGSAQPVAAAIDQQNWPELVGTVGGDDTILCVCADKRAANRLAHRVREVLD
jgi:transcriptional regulator of arginine metabolism